MAKKDVDDILSEIDAFIEEEKQPKRKRRSKVEMDAEVEQEELVEEVKPLKRSRRKREVSLEIESEVEDVIEKTIPVPQEEDVIEEVEMIKNETSVDMSEDEDDDLYLTSSFKPIKKKKRLKRGIIKFFKTLVILGIIGLIGWIVGNKLYDMYLETKPINIYKRFVKETGKTLNGFINSIPSTDSGMVEIQFETNMKTYEYLNNNVIGYGYSNDKDGYEDYVYYLDGNYDRRGLHTLVKNNRVYRQYDNSDIVYSSKLEDSMLRDILQETDIDFDLINDVIEGNTKVISNIIKEEDIEVSEEELGINGTFINVKCNTLVLSEDFVDRYIEELYKDTVLVNKMSKLFDKDYEVLIRYLDDKLSELANDVKFNLYITKKYEFVGFDYELDGFREMYYYQYKGNKDINIKLGDKTNLGVDVKDKDVDVLIDNESMFNLVIKELEKNVINFQYKNNDSTVSMDILIKKDNIIIEYKNDNGKYIDVDIRLFDYEKVIDTSKVTTSSKKQEVAKDNFNKYIKKDQKNAYNLIYSIIYGN